VTQTSSEEDDRILRDLMCRYQAGDGAAFEEFYNRTRPLVHRYHSALAISGSQASDLTQDTFLQLHRSRHLYDPRLPVTPWLLAIARHVRLMAARVVRRRLAREVPLPDRDIDRAAPADAILDKAILAQALARLPEHFRDPIVLHHLLGVSFRDIAGIVGSSEGGARIRASRGMSTLRRLLDDTPPCETHTRR
jgi:RNA polymerase sigma-70 factor (ECF subfamily)